jgi:hypothetical protein
VSIYKGKGDALECNLYRGIKWLEHAMKVFEQVIEARLREKVDIDDMQFGSREGKSTTDAIFIVRQLQEKYLEKKKELWMAFIDLEKAFDSPARGDMVGVERVRSGGKFDFGDKINVCWSNDSSQDRCK